MASEPYRDAMTQPSSQPSDPNAAGADQSGSGYPPPGQYPPPGGYPPPGHPRQPAAPPPGYASGEEKTYALIAHFGGAVGALVSLGVLGFIGPLISLLAKGDESPTVKAHARAALNFFVPVTGVAVLLIIMRTCNDVFTPGLLAGLINLLLYLVQAAVWVVAMIFGVVAGVKANEGALYRYPVSLPIIK
jgi:uncharacterized Tic20 family protein